MKAKPFLIGFFALIAGLVAVSVYVSMTVDKADKSVSAIVSPDGRYKAVRVSISRGGAALFCFDSISILLAVYPDNFAEHDKTYEIYSAPCAAPAERAASPKVEWLSNTAVRIIYSQGPAGPDTNKRRMKVLDASEFVHVTFVARE